jgi:mannosyltransferase OCH1-like enzyme
MATWQDMNPELEYRLWTAADLPKLRFDDRVNYLVEKGRYATAADIMRVDILEQHGGVFIDADSLCLQPIQDAPFMEASFFVGWDYPDRRGNRPPAVANGVIGSTARHPVLRDYLKRIEKAGLQKHWLLGARMLTQAIEGHEVLVLPTCTFYPRNWDGRTAPSDGEVYAKQFWATTKGGYVNL